MAEYPGMTLTIAGIEMIAESQVAGAVLTITKVNIGDGQLPEGANIQDMKNVISVKLAAPFSAFKNSGNGKIHVEFAVSNANLEKGFFAREIGIMAKLGEDGTEKLYAYSNAGNKCDWIPDKNTPVDSQVIDCELIIGNAPNVTVMVSDESMVSVKMMNEHIADSEAHQNMMTTHNKDLHAHPNRLRPGLKRSTVYAVGDIAFHDGLPSWAYLECTQAGTTAETEPDFQNGGGKSVTDGTVVWRVKDSRCPYTLGQFVCKLGWPKDYEYLLLCDGSTISQTNYPELCAVLGGTQLPNLIGRTLQGNSVGGEYKAPGLPNITAYIGRTETVGSVKPGGACWSSYPLQDYTWSDTQFTGDSLQYVHFSAALSNPIYGASATVQPPAYTTRIYICYAG